MNNYRISFAGTTMHGVALDIHINDKIEKYSVIEDLSLIENLAQKIRENNKYALEDDKGLYIVIEGSGKFYLEQCKAKINHVHNGNDLIWLNRSDYIQAKLMDANKDWLALEIDGVTKNYPYSGNGECTHTWHLQQIQQNMEIGKTYDFVIREGIVAHIKHPRLTMDNFTLKKISIVDLTIETICNLLGDQMTLFEYGSYQLDQKNGQWCYGSYQLKQTDDGLYEIIDTDNETIKNDKVVIVNLLKGYLNICFEKDGIIYEDDYIVLRDIVLPDIIKSSCKGRPISDVVELPFKHSNPRITAIRSTSDHLIISYEIKDVEAITVQA